MRSDAIRCDCKGHKGKNDWHILTNADGWMILYFSHPDATRGYHPHDEDWCPKCIEAYTNFVPETGEPENEETDNLAA